MSKPAIRTTCPYCGVGCGLRVHASGARSLELAGDTAHPANRGLLCSKGTALGETVGLDNRLLYPEIGGERASWDMALDRVAERFSDIVARHGPDAVAFYVSGQLLTEDYYVANKLMKGFIGSGNIDTNSRLCMSSTVAGHKRAFGADAVPGNYEDWELADLVVLVGSNTAWCHPVLYRRLLAAREKRGTRIVVIDPRRTATCDEADLHLALKPGSDVRLFNALLVHLAANDHADEEFVGAATEGLDATLAAACADGSALEAVARDCGLDAADLETFFSWFAGTERTLTVFSQGVNQSSQGVDKVNAIINCHLLTGRIGRPGMGPFSVTGQPNAMGGREVGGLANQLAAHMEFTAEHRDIVARFWRARRMAPHGGLTAVDMFRAVGEGRIKAIWIAATNPAVSLPDASRVREALARCEFIVVSDCIAGTDTGRYAHVALPAAAWGEKDGTVTNSERRISRQRAFLPPPGEARPDWWMFTQVAQRMGFADAFPYTAPAQIFREHAALSAFENHGSRIFDIGGLANIPDSDYDALKPVQWPVTPARREGTARLFTDRWFTTEDGRARFVAVHAGRPANLPTERFPLALNTGRLRDQWHTMTRTGLAPTLARHSPEPAVDLHPDDIAANGLADDGFARVVTRFGQGTFRVRATQNQRAGTAFLPIHWSDTGAADAVTGRLVNPVIDPISKQPEFKHTPARVEPVVMAWRGFALSRTAPVPPAGCYWAAVALKGGYLYEIAGETGVEPPSPSSLFGEPAATGEILEMHDARRGNRRFARIDDERLTHCLMIAAQGRLPPRAWLAGLLAADRLGPAERQMLLAGAPSEG
ncbi:molybdopterin oxidoreductase family protein, partial [Parvibaculum sp.]|uniref:molybdopterin oxidoreductase family protein n=1 Tax=Parvibaculum sp. TaxID=2024848 RepID=UPI0034A0404A